jgi:hypothetical protein
MLNIDRDDLKALKNIGSDVLTLYLNVNPGNQANQNTPPAWQIFVKNQVREVEKHIDPETHAGWQSIKARLEQLLAEYSPSAKTLVAFISADQTQTYELPVTLDNAAGFGAPLLPPLIWALDEYERYLVTLVDQERARFFTAYLGNATETDQHTLDIEDYDFRQKTQMPANAGADSGNRAVREGSNRDRFEDMIAAHVERFHKGVAGRVRELAASTGATRIIIGGAERAMHAVHDELDPDHMQQPVLLMGSLRVDAAEHEVAERIQERALNHERSYENDLVEAVVGSAAANGHGAAGYDAVQQALTLQAVDVLILPWPADDQKQAATMTLQALDSGASIELVHGAAASKLREAGGVAARLYFPLPT